MDTDRIKAVGPNRACAEWLLRCGASVKFMGYEKWNNDYNLLPTGAKEKYVIEEVDATDSCIMHIGFPHFGEWMVEIRFADLINPFQQNHGLGFMAIRPKQNKMFVCP